MCLLSRYTGLQALCQPVAPRVAAVPVVLERISDLPLALCHLPSLLLLIGTFGLDQAYDIVHWEIAEFVSLGAKHGDLVLGVSCHTVRVGRGG